MRIDVNGKADYFTILGLYIKSDNNMNDPYIYIQTDNGNVKLDQYKFNGLRPMMRIAFHYINSIDENIKGATIGVDSRRLKGIDPDAVAYTQANHIRLMVKDGHFKGNVGQIYNMKSTLQHEAIHYNDNIQDKSSEVKIIIQQMNHQDFKKTTSDFKMNVCGYLQNELVKLYKESPDAFNNYIDSACALLKQYGAKSTFEYIDGGNEISF